MQMEPRDIDDAATLLALLPSTKHFYDLGAVLPS